MFCHFAVVNLLFMQADGSQSLNTYSLATCGTGCRAAVPAGGST